jgi:hypothetical protein
VTPTTRYLCPLPDCGWHHDEPDPTADEALQIVRNPAADDPAYHPVMGYRTAPELAAEPPRFTGFADLVAPLVGRAMLQRATRVEARIEAHVSTHSVLEWMREVQRLNDLLAAATTPTDREPPC